MSNLWLGSVCALVAATGVDAASSWGHREANGLLASRDGDFGTKGVAFKLVSVSAVLVPEIMLRRHASMLKVFALANTAEAGIYTAAAVHNFKISSR